MDFRQLKYFLVVSEELSFSKAAERCFISQSAISHQIARLEKELNTTLFERSTRTVALSPAGSRLVPIAQQVLSLETMAYSVARDPHSRIRITGNMSFAAQTLDAITRIRDLYPDLDVEFVIKSFAHRMDAVASGDADIALIRGGVDRPGLDLIDLGVEDLLIVTSTRHPLAGGSTVELDALAAFPLLLPPRQSQVLIHKVVEDAFREIGRRVQLGPSIPSDHTATLDVITNPQAWTLLYSITAGESPRAGISFMREAHGRLRIPVSGVTRSGAPRTPEFVDLINAMKQSMNLPFTE